MYITDGTLMTLTHISLASLFFSGGGGVEGGGDIGKRHSPRYDAAEQGIPSGTILFA